MKVTQNSNIFRSEIGCATLKMALNVTNTDEKKREHENIIHQNIKKLMRKIHQKRYIGGIYCLQHTLLTTFLLFSFHLALCLPLFCFLVSFIGSYSNDNIFFSCSSVQRIAKRGVEIFFSYALISFGIWMKMNSMA